MYVSEISSGPGHCAHFEQNFGFLLCRNYKRYRPVTLPEFLVRLNVDNKSRNKAVAMSGDLGLKGGLQGLSNALDCQIKTSKG